MWVGGPLGGVADSQTRSKPLKIPANHPENRLFWPFVFPNLTKTLGWVGKKIWERSPKESSFFMPSLIRKWNSYICEKLTLLVETRGNPSRPGSGLCSAFLSSLRCQLSDLQTIRELQTKHMLCLKTVCWPLLIVQTTSRDTPQDICNVSYVGQV